MGKAKKLGLYQINCEQRSFMVESPSVTDMMTQRFWARHRFYEGALLQFIRSFQLPGVYVDVGAMLGNHGVFFTNFCHCAKLIAIEAVPETYQVMIKNVRRNLPEGLEFEPHNAAAYSKAGSIGTWPPVYRRNIGATTLTIRDRRQHDTFTTKPPRSINTTRIDDVVRARDDVVVIKIDIEGGEAPAIIGACDTITRCNPLLIAEALTPKHMMQIDELMEMFDYVRLSKTPKKKTYLWWHKDVVKSRNFKAAE